MSYITIPRLVFSGGFQADVSTVNNDVRHFDNDAFLPRFQLPMVNNDELNGWYNPDGTGNFRLFDLRVTQALSALDANPSEDLATGLWLNAQRERSSCKIVDLDPQMQAVSMLFGLRLVLTNGETDFLSGNFTPSAFRDIFMAGGGPRSALYMSTLTELEWSDEISKSPTLVALKAAADANDNTLAVNLTPYNYGANQMGGLVGSIGAWHIGEPDTFASCRRLMTSGTSSLAPLNADVASGALSFDLTNAIALTPGQSAPDLGKLFGAVLRRTEKIEGKGTSSAAVVPAKTGEQIIEQGDVIPASDLVLLDEINYAASDFLSTHGAIADCKIAGTHAEGLISDHPVAIVTPDGSGTYKVVIRETLGGLYARGDHFVLRLNPPVSGTLNDSVRFRVTQWGKGVKDVTVTTAPVSEPPTGQNPNPYWGGGNVNQYSPKAPYPPINTSPRAMSVSNQMTTGNDGWAACGIACKNPGNPRGYVDGQIYTSTYQVAVANASPQAYLDLIVAHTREAHDYPNPPDWERDVAPFMQQYDNLYPIMSKHLFSLADPEVLKQHARLLTLAFSQPMDNPNHMPATRDLSASKTQAILNWLSQYTGEPAPEAAALMAASAPAAVNTADIAHLPQPRRASVEELEAKLAAIEAHDMGGKTSVVRNYLASEIARLSQEG